jgi:hypothetical protein
MRYVTRRLDEQAFERLCEHMAVAVVHCSDQQVLDLADSLHAALRRRRKIARSHSDRLSDPAELYREGSFAPLET